MTHLMAEELNALRLRTAREQAEQHRRFARARRGAASRRWLRVADHARQRAARAAE
jgi:hypothetical protein